MVFKNHKKVYEYYRNAERERERELKGSSFFDWSFFPFAYKLAHVVLVFLCFEIPDIVRKVHYGKN